MLVEEGQRMSPEEFEFMVQTHVLRGWRVVERSDTTAVLTTDPQINHVLHAVLTLFTLGLWFPIWILVMVANRPQKLVLSVWENRAIWLTKHERRLLEPRRAA